MMGRSDRNHFDSIWKRKSRTEPQAGYVPGSNLRVDKAVEVLRGGTRLLDIGCGDGTLLALLQSRFRAAQGIDISEEAVRLARQKGMEASILNLNLEPLPYPDGNFDVVTILSTLQYIYDLDKFLKECRRVLSGSGVMLMSVPNMRALWRIGRLLIQGSFPRVSLDQEGFDGGTLHYFAFADLRRLLGKHGFQVAWAHGIFCLPRFIERFPNGGLIGTLKREFFSAEIFIMANKVEAG